jgi:hypothetical protein
VGPRIIRVVTALVGPFNHPKQPKPSTFTKSFLLLKSTAQYAQDV